MIFASLVCGVMSALAEEEEFQKYVEALPLEKRHAAIQRRRDQRAEEQRRREHAEMIEAMKPHNLWSFLGLGRK